jgi:hypothetical protein
LSIQQTVQNGQFVTGLAQSALGRQQVAESAPSVWADFPNNRYRSDAWWNKGHVAAKLAHILRQPYINHFHVRQSSERPDASILRWPDAMWPISTRVNKPENDDRLFEPIERAASA